MDEITSWLIVLLVVGVIGLVAYRYYMHPSLSQAGKEQKENYIRSLQCGKTLHYQMQLNFIIEFKAILGKLYFNAGNGCYYGQNSIISLESEDTHVSIHIFGPTEEDLQRTIWRLTQIRNKIGGNTRRVAHG